MSLIEKLQRQLVEIQAKIKAFEEYPDLEEVKDRWGIIHLASEEVNLCAQNFEIRAECECCDGVKVYALPYIEYEGIRLYSKTPAISFAKRYKKGDTTYLYDDAFSEDWQDFNLELQDKLMMWIDDQESQVESEA